MDAVVLREFGSPERLTLERVLAPAPGDDDLLVRVHACGVCGHDLLARRGRLGGTLPRILGHEIAGVVASAGAAVVGFAPGDRVVLNQRRSCGACRACRAGAPNHCVAGAGFYGEDVPGGYAQFVLAGAQNVVALPSEISMAAAAALPCGVVTALHALRRARLGLEETVVVVGAGGGVGIHAVALAYASGARVVAATHRPEKAGRLKAAGADLVLVAAGDDLPAAVRAAVGGPVDAVIDCAGIAVQASARLLRHGGRLILLGNIDPGPLGVSAGLLIVKEIAVLGSSHGTPAELALAVELVRAGTLEPVVAAELPLAAAAEAHRCVETGAVAGRVVLTIA